METEQRRRSAKTSKKDGKCVTGLSVEEEARRREVVKERLREKLDADRRALQVVERLLEDCVAQDFLADCAKFITAANYKDAIEERLIAKLCGYPICSNKLGKIPTQKYKISTKTNKVYDITERKCFCSNFCYKASKEFELQISTTPLWLRPHEDPRQIKLLKKGDGGSTGEEVLLSAGRLQEADVENPDVDPPADPPSPSVHRRSSLSDSNSDPEQEQDFVSSVIPPRQGPRVHWGALPKRTDDEEEKAERSRSEGEVREDERERLERDDPEVCCPDESGVKEAAKKLTLCTLSETLPQPVDPARAENTDLPQRKHAHTVTDSENAVSSTAPGVNQDIPAGAQTDGPGLNITQVGMSKRGAQGLRDLLKNVDLAVANEPKSLRVNLLEGLRRTLKEWSTAETLRFLYGAQHALGGGGEVKKEEEEGEVEEKEELDEDDLEDEEKGEEEQDTPSAPAPDYDTLKKETQQHELRVREFYRPTRVDKVTVQDESEPVPRLPLVDSTAQHLIQKRITVEKLTSCLKNIIGPLRLTMSDISTDLNKLVRTFRFTSTNIIHKAPEWTLIAVVLLHLLCEVSPVVREALETAASAAYLNTLMDGLGIQEQDLLNLVQLFKTQAY